MASNPKNIDKAFIDSSVLIAAAISSAGSARDLIMKALRVELKAIISDLVLEEIAPATIGASFASTTFATFNTNVLEGRTTSGFKTSKNNCRAGRALDALFVKFL